MLGEGRRWVERPLVDEATVEAYEDAQARVAEAQAEVDALIESFELVFRMQTEAPELMSIDGESEATRRLYGLDDPVTSDFGLRCLLARPFFESGVRFVQATHGPDTKWDHHSGLITGLPQSCAEIDKPVAGLIADLKSRGLLDETLVLWGGEFGRTPGAEAGARNGRDHNPHGYTMFMAGGGVKPASAVQSSRIMPRANVSLPSQYPAHALREEGSIEHVARGVDSHPSRIGWSSLKSVETEAGRRP